MPDLAYERDTGPLEMTDIYFYRDVVSVATVSASFTLTLVGDTDAGTIHSDSFKLTTSGGTVISCALGGLDPTIEKKIQGARKLIRRKSSIPDPVNHAVQRRAGDSPLVFRSYAAAPSSSITASGSRYGSPYTLSRTRRGERRPNAPTNWKASAGVQAAGDSGRRCRDLGEQLPAGDLLLASFQPVQAGGVVRGLNDQGAQNAAVLLQGLALLKLGVPQRLDQTELGALGLASRGHLADTSRSAYWARALASPASSRARPRSRASWYRAPPRMSRAAPGPHHPWDQA